jgi:thiamine biosynthesis protein ThiI
MLLKEIILLKNGEIALKGLNRGTFEDTLIKNIRRRIKSLGVFSVTKSQSTICIEPRDEDVDMDELIIRLQKIFGIAAICRSCLAPKDMEQIMQIAAEYAKFSLNSASTFKIEARRADKKFPLKSPEICNEVGGYILQKFPHLKVDVHHPEVTITVEIRDTSAYINFGVIPGAGGMPVGSNGRACLLVSGGIDSPVAGWMLSKRGVELTAVHFASPPYTSERAELKVHSLCRQLSKWSGKIHLIVIPFTKIQEEIRKNCPEDLFTLIMRRIMMKIAAKIAIHQDCKALITGESLGQVASQTIDSIFVTDNASELPVFRPLIGMDKEEIITIARKIDTFDISILPYEDCCTVFTPKHPRTRPQLNAVIEAESTLDVDLLANDAISLGKWIDL